MARPRKNRIGDYARLLGEEIGIQLNREIAKSLAQTRHVFLDELEELRTELRKLSRRLDALTRRNRGARPSLGKWVPGGPGRPPKDALDRIAAFESRAQRTPAPKPGRPPRAPRKD